MSGTLCGVLKTGKGSQIGQFVHRSMLDSHSMEKLKSGAYLGLNISLVCQELVILYEIIVQKSTGRPGRLSFIQQPDPLDQLTTSQRRISGDYNNMWSSCDLMTSCDPGVDLISNFRIVRHCRIVQSAIDSWLNKNNYRYVLKYLTDLGSVAPKSISANKSLIPIL